MACHLINLLPMVVVVVLIPTLSITAVRSAAIATPEDVDVVRTFSSLANITVTKVITTTAIQATTTTKSELQICTTLAAPLAIAPCRRQMMPLWGVVHHEDIDQFHSVNPTDIFKVEPSSTPEVTSSAKSGISIPIVSLADVDVEPSFSDPDGATPVSSIQSTSPPNKIFSALFSSLLSGWQIPTTVTVTRIETIYTATSTATLFTSTSTYTLSVTPPCLPADFLSCPSEELITENPDIEIPSSTDVI